jgi:hypothetical protein
MSTFQGPVEEDSIPSYDLAMNAHFRRKIDKNPYQTPPMKPDFGQKGCFGRSEGGQKGGFWSKGLKRLI